MSSIFEDGALHPGRDANDSWWVVVRHAADWGTAFTGTVFDASRGVVELAPAPMEGVDPPNEVIAADGTIYRADPVHDRVLWRRSCDPTFAPIPGLGGTGDSTGRFRGPAGLAVDARGWVYVADRGNHRVQVLDPAHRRVVIVLPATDPVAVAVGAGRIYVGEAAGRILVHDRAFRFDRAFVAAEPGAGTPELIGLAADGDSVVVADAAAGQLRRYRCTGAYLGDVAFANAPAGLSWLVDAARFTLDGTVVVGPIDGGVDQLAWHEIAVDADLPAGSSIEIQTYAADAGPSVPPAPPPGAPSLPTATPWAPALPVAMPAAGADPDRGERIRPVLSDTARWELARGGPYRRGAVVHTFTGDGPNGVAAMSVPAEAARLLRADDGVELKRATVEPATILSISDRSATLAAAGTRALYGAGSTLQLVERDGHPLDPATIHSLAGGETIDLSGFAADGDVRELLLPHAVAAVLADGDVLVIDGPPGTARLWVSTLARTAATVTLTAPVSGDFSLGTLRLVSPAHRLVVDDADGWGAGVPAGTEIDIDWNDAGTVRTAAATVVWSDPPSATLWTAAPAPATWLAFAPGQPAGATDRGRWLWIKLCLRGARAAETAAVATATPSVHALRVVAPRLSYLTYLPAVYSRRDADDPSGALFLERFLAIAERRLTRVEARYEDVARQLNPLAADPDWVEFVAGWFALVFDPSWPTERRALLLSEIFELYRRRGTVGGLRRIVEIYTGHRPEIREGFQMRPRAGSPLGIGALGCAPLGRGAPAVSDGYAHRFTLVAYVDDACDLEVMRTSLRALVDAMKPAHTLVDLRVDLPRSRIGLASTIGFDFVLGDERNAGAPLGTSGPSADPAPVLGVNATLRANAPGPSLDDGGDRVGGFSID